MMIRVDMYCLNCGGVNEVYDGHPASADRRCWKCKKPMGEAAMEDYEHRLEAFRNASVLPAENIQVTEDSWETEEEQTEGDSWEEEDHSSEESQATTEMQEAVVEEEPQMSEEEARAKEKELVQQAMKDGSWSRVPSVAMTRAASKVMVTTGNGLTRYDTLKEVDVVSAEVVYSYDFFHDIFSATRHLQDERVVPVQQLMKDAQREAIDDIRVEALKLGCNAVLNLNLNYVEIGQKSRMIGVIANGTAVKVRSKSRSKTDQ